MNFTFSNLSFLIIFKLLFILFMIIVSIYVVFKEIKIMKAERVPEYTQAGFFDGSFLRVIKSIAAASAGLASIYGGAISFKHEVNKANELVEAAEKLEKAKGQYHFELSSLQSEKISLKRKMLANHKTIVEKLEEAEKARKKVDDAMIDAETLLDKINRLRKENQNKTSSINYLETLEKQFSIKEANMKVLRLQAQEAFRKLETTSKSIETELENTVEKAFIGSNFVEFFESYNAIGKLAISLFFFNYVVLSSLITIVFIYYGDFLIKYFNLELKYPKLAKIIQLRRKFQGYYFLFSIFSIAFVVLIETLFSIYVLTL